MTSEELASEVKKAVSAAVQERILGVGKDQYDLGDKQEGPSPRAWGSLAGGW